MSSFPRFTEKWDKEVKPFALQVFNECRTDLLVAFHASEMIFGIDHDLADDRVPHSRLHSCVVTLNDENYYLNVHKLTSPDEVKKLKKLGRLLEELQELDIQNMIVKKNN